MNSLSRQLTNSMLSNHNERDSFIFKEPNRPPILHGGVMDKKEHTFLMKEHMKDNIEERDEHIYYNFEVNNPSTSATSIDLKFSINRVREILDKPTDWEFGVERFSCPATIPIFIDDEVNFPLQVNIFDPNLNLNYALNVDLFNNALIMPPFQTQYNNYINNGVYSYSRLVAAVNTALVRCAVLFNAGHPDLDFPDDDEGELAAPFIRYFQSTGNFSLYAPQEDIDPIVPLDPRLFFDQGRLFPQSSNGASPTPQPLQIRFSRQLAKLFSGLAQFNYGDNDPLDQGGLPVLMVIQDLIFTPGTQAINNTNIVDIRSVNYMYATTQWDVRPEMNQFDKILFLTDSLPVKDELEGEARDVVQRQMIDYVITNRLQDRSQINYFPQYVKWNDLESSTELKRLDMTVFIEYRDKTKYILKLQPNERFSAKLVFRRKNKL